MVVPGSQSPPLGKARDGSEVETMAFKGPRVSQLEPVGISAWPQPFHPLPRGLGEARYSQGGVILLSLLLPSIELSLT